MTDLFSKFNIQDKIIVITGGEGVLGGTLAIEFAAIGAKIAILGINEEGGNKIREKIVSKGGDALFFCASVLDKESLVKVRDDIIREWGRIDVLINAAGGNSPGATIGPGKNIFDLNIEDFKKVSELNLNGTVIPSLVFGEPMSAQGRGSIVNYSSMASERPLSRIVAYSAAKAAVDNFTRWMAVEMAQKFGEGLRVNAIAPGFLVTNQNRDLLLKPDGSLTARGEDIIKQTPFGRFGEPEELTATVLWLISEASSFITGTVIPVDGGFSAYSGV